MQTNEFILMEPLSFDVKAEADDFFQPLFQLAQGACLGMAPLQIGNDTDIEAVLILFDDDRKAVVLHA